MANSSGDGKQTDTSIEFVTVSTRTPWSRNKRQTYSTRIARRGQEIDDDDDDDDNAISMRTRRGNASRVRVLCAEHVFWTAGHVDEAKKGHTHVWRCVYTRRPRMDLNGMADEVIFNESSPRDSGHGPTTAWCASVKVFGHFLYAWHGVCGLSLRSVMRRFRMWDDDLGSL